MAIDPFTRGKPILASVLNQMHRKTSKVGDRPSGIPGGGIPVDDRDDPWVLFVAVKARLVSSAAVIEEHGYVVTDGANDYTIEWNQIILPVQPSLVGPERDPGALPQGFVPAEIAGQERALTEPWRAWGVLYRGPSPDGDGETVAAVELFGLSPHRGC